MDKQIEEMTNIMFEYALAIDGFSPEIKKAMEEVSTKQAIKKALWGYAKALYDAGYRKIPELPQETVLTVDDIAELLTIVARETRKKTARKFAKRLKEMHYYEERLCDISDKICKEIIGEV